MLNMLALLQGAAGGSAVGPGLSVIGGGLAVIGAGIGIGLIGGRMTEAIARQPESYTQIQTAAIILAALVEGVAFFALVIAGFIK
jgi:F-type H+-transporting ATPase subunit c